MSTTCLSALKASRILIEQFRKSLSSRSPLDSTDDQHSSPLLLLKAAADTLKSTTTKLSLLTITAPFTHSAVISLLKILNDSVLPALATATLLVSPQVYPKSFCDNCSRLTTRTFTNLENLLQLIEERALTERSNLEASPLAKQNITESTGRVWEDCDNLTKFVVGDVSGFVVKEVEQWLSLMKDAVKELQEWDPEELVDDDVFGQLDDENNAAQGDSTKDVDQVMIATGVKEQALKVLTRIPQSVHVVVKQRLAKLPQNAQEAVVNKTLDEAVTTSRRISECIDESAEAMYIGNPEQCLKKAGEARALTIDLVELVIKPWSSENAKEGTKEDTYIKRALTWIEQVDPGGVVP